MTRLNRSLREEQKASFMNDFLVVENVSKTYSKANGEQLVVLKDINFSVGSEEYISVIGHSGCGKSTLVRIVAGLERQSAGFLTLDGKEIRKPGAERMMVFQGYSLLPWLTVRENIHLAVDEVFKKASRAEKNSIVEEHLTMVKLTHAGDKYPDELSGGMKQRVGLARALATRPKMLLLDEPFGALDALTRPNLQQQVIDIWENHRQAVIMITHDVEEAVFMSDRVIMMTNGPSATIGKIMDIPLPRPRDRHQLQDCAQYFELRKEALNFLEDYQ
ncbi:ABC transporter ATP-binding protein [Gloeocapsa sp. PCC 73106]|uniref:ABC transporter ATP-binding protein n=1 Tax=Gloeocapsa sp. PCC 73106 TaxID=102232 RepID=UPI0002ACFED5|nr:ABC transporter ATP-binding protein [Gloeocapsa sp. PCC 73106]ELR98929.1 nitrate transport ATP-binding subunits C and D [Gloeocapsa sp. PCC 73106]